MLLSFGGVHAAVLQNNRFKFQINHSFVITSLFIEA